LCRANYAGESSIEVKTEADPPSAQLRLYSSAVCDKQSPAKSSLEVHGEKHTDENCNSGTVSGNHLSCSSLQKYVNIQRGGRCCGSSHKLAVHGQCDSGEKSFECTVCGKQVTTSRELVAHRRIHSGEKPYKCHICHKALSRSGCLRDHIRIHTGEKPYKCSVCNRSFRRSGYLQKHKHRVHSTELDLHSYKCRICDKVFCRHQHLTRHMRVHMGDKPTTGQFGLGDVLCF